MLRNIAKFECVLEGRLFQLLCDNDSPTVLIKEFIFQISKTIGQIEDQAKAQQQENNNSQNDSEQKEESNDQSTI